MVRVVYLGDEVTAAGYRLAGAEVYVPAAAEAADAIRQACSGDDELGDEAGVELRAEDDGGEDVDARRREPLAVEPSAASALEFGQHGGALGCALGGAGEGDIVGGIGLAVGPEGVAEPGGAQVSVDLVGNHAIGR